MTTMAITKTRTKTMMPMRMMVIIMAMIVMTVTGMTAVMRMLRTTTVMTWMAIKTTSRSKMMIRRH